MRDRTNLLLLPDPEPAPLALPVAWVPAGFPSPAEEYLDHRLDLNERLVRNPAATFFIRVAGESMRGAGIASGDILVVDRSLDPRPGHVVVAAVDGCLTIKRLKRRGGVLVLAPENPDYPDIPLGPETDAQVWGVATYVVHGLAPCSWR